MFDPADPKFQDELRRVQAEREMFEIELREFVRRWGPRSRYDRLEFQQQMLRLLTGAMHSQSSLMGYTINQYASHVALHRASQPLYVIMDDPKIPKKETKP